MLSRQLPTVLGVCIGKVERAKQHRVPHLCSELFGDLDQFRLRLRYGYLVTCTGVVKNERGEVIEIHCTYDPATRGGNAPDGRKVKYTIHWVSAEHAVDAEVRLYDTLFTKENPDDVPEGQDFTANLNPNSLEVLKGCKLEPSLRGAAPGSRCQFERLGYFCVDDDSKAERPVFNRTVALRDAWAKIEKKSAT